MLQVYRIFYIFVSKSKHMRKSVIIPATLLILGCGSIYAKPAIKDLIPVVQPDGSILKIKKIGDENFHLTLTEEGNLLAEQSDGSFSLGQLAPDGSVISTGISPFSKEAEKVATKITDLDIVQIQQKRNAKRRAPQTGLGLFTSHFPKTGSPKGLIILVEYSDVKFKTSYDAKTYFNELTNGRNFTQYGGTGSALQYFTDQSAGKFTPDFDVLGPVTLPQKQSYYGANDRYGDDQNAHLMVTDALAILDSTTDFSVYDTDNDGVLDYVYIYYAGQGEADYGSANTVWPHSWDLREAGINKKVDGKIVGPYACSNEWGSSKPEGIGTFVHEFSHVMGLPDLYHTTSSSADYTPGEYSVMDYGPYNNDGRTPPNYGAYEKNAMGWFEPIMLDSPQSVTLEEISTGKFGLIPTKENTEFFLLENRQQTGWDKYIPGHGMLIWHIDYNQKVFENNQVNNNRSHQYVDIVEANGNPSSRQAAGFPFPGTTNKTSFTATTTPALKSWSGEAIYYPVTDIKETDGIITFDVAGGGSSLSKPQPEVLEYSQNNMFFLAQWEPVEGATDYFITVYENKPSAYGKETMGFDNSTVGSGWTASQTGWYDTNSNYGVKAPSFKFSNNGQTLESPETDGDISRISFWAKGQTTDGTYLIIEGLKDGAWCPITEYTPLTNKSETVSVEEIPSGVQRIRFTMVKSKGNIAIDDIEITYGTGSNPLQDYNHRSTNGQTIFKIDNLTPGVLEYYFYVEATDGKHTTASAPLSVLIDGEFSSTSVSMIPSKNENIEYFNMQGLRVLNPTPGMILIERRGNKVRKVVK